MAFAFDSVLVYDSGSSSSATVTGWTGITDGNIGFALVSRSELDTAPSGDPSGWTSLGSVSRTTFEPEYIELFYRIKQSGDSNPTWTWAVADKTRISIGVYADGFDAADPINDSSNVEYTVASSVIRAASVNAIDNGPIVWIGCFADTFGAFVTAPTGFAEDSDQGSGTSRLWHFLCSDVSTSTAATGNIDGNSLGNGNKHAFAVAMNPGGTSYESDLGTGAMSLSSGTPSSQLTRVADLNTGNLALSSGDLTVTDAALGTGNLSFGSAGVGSIANLYADLDTGVLSLGSTGIGVFDRYEADLGTGTMVLGATRLKEPEDIAAGNLELGAWPLQTVQAKLLDYNQGRYFSIPAERMRSCVWADNFASAYKTRQIGGTVPDSVSYTNSVTLDGLSYVTYNEQPLTNVLSAVVKFSADAASSGLLFGTVDPITPTVDGWRIWVDATGIRANHSDGTALGTQCTVDYDYADGEIHTVTYVVDMVSGNHVLYVDTEDDTQSTTATGTVGTGRQLSIGGVGFVGTVQRARLFESVLSAEEHAVYYADSLSSIFNDSIATYRCDTVCDQTDHVWTKTLNLYDLTKGDGVSAGYPTHNAQGHYVFDGVDDYVSDWPTQPTLHTDSIAKTTSYPDGVPAIQQVNDDTIKTLLTTGGSYTGNLHSLVLCTGELTDLEKKHLEYRQLQRLVRDTYVDPFHHSLMVDGSNSLHIDFRDSSNYDYDYSNTSATVSSSGVTWDDGLQFPNISSAVTVSDEAALRSDAITLHASGGFDFVGIAFPTIDTIAEKGANYSLAATYIDTAVTFSFNGQSFSSIGNTGIYSVAVSCVDGSQARLYINGEYSSSTSSAVIVDGSDTTDITIGNTPAGSENIDGTMYTFNFYNTVLTDLEIRRAYNNTRVDKGFQ